jgi:hypothetical protein
LLRSGRAPRRRHHQRGVGCRATDGGKAGSGGASGSASASATSTQDATTTGGSSSSTSKKSSTTAATAAAKEKEAVADATLPLGGGGPPVEVPGAFALAAALSLGWEVLRGGLGLALASALGVTWAESECVLFWGGKGARMPWADAILAVVEMF